MKILFNRNNSIGIFCLLLLLAVGAVSCIKDEYAENKEKATVQVTFMTRAVTTSTTSGDALLPNERMQSLRVIVANGSNILYNVYYKDFEKDEDGRFYKTITFSELTTVKGTDLDFYAIANESGLGDGNDLSEVTIDGLKNIELDNNFLTNANAMNSTTLIPQTAYKRISVNPTGGNRIQKEYMELNFVVAKLRLTINNASTVEQTVSNISISNALVNTTPLLRLSENKELTTSTNPLGLSDMTIPAEGTLSTWRYIYEYTRNGGFHMSANWPDVSTYKEIAEPSITDVPRGTELDINVTLSVNTEPEIEVLVIPWAEKSMGVEFN